MLLGRTFTSRAIHPFFEFQYTAIAFSHSLLLQLSEEIRHTYFYQVKPLANFTVLHSPSTFLKTDSIKGKPVLNNLGSGKNFSMNIWLQHNRYFYFFPGRSYCKKCDMAHIFKILPNSQGCNACGWTQPHIQTRWRWISTPCKFLSRKPEWFFANLLLKS